MNFADYLFENSKHIGNVFLEGEDGTVCYKELYTLVNTLSTHINEKYGTNNQMLLLSDNNLFFIVSYLSIIKSGNVAVLVETRISESDLKTVLDNCVIKCFFVQNKYVQKLDVNNTLITEDILESSHHVSDDFTAKTIESDVAVIIFTSGSTGTKKGVMLSHKNLISNTNSIIEYLELKKSDKILIVLPFYYCYGASLLHTHLRVGGSIVMDSSIFLGSVLNSIKNHNCTGFSGVPSTFQILINRTSFLEQDFPSLRYFTQAGGKLENKFIEQIADSFPDKLFFVMYGATEATARLSYLPPSLVKDKMGSIGKGIPGVTLEIIDSSENKVKPGEIGEITAKGDNIMKGYLNDSVGTKTKIINGRLYTGDLATIDEDGYIYIKGRANNLIKSAGYRISPYEIEEMITSLEGVDTCVVIGITDDLMGEAVTAIVQPSSESTSELKKSIKNLCGKKLPSYKKPKYVVFIDDFPLNSSNKIDRLKLRKIVENDMEKERTSTKLTSVDELLKLPPYSLKEEKKKEILLPIIKKQLLKSQNNTHIKNLFQKQGIDIDKLKSLEEVPFLPVQMFKHFDLETCPTDEIFKILKSSGTTSNKKSRVPLNKSTSLNQTKALKSILSDYLGNKRRIFLVIDHERMNSATDSFSARTAGIRGLSMYSKKIFYLLKEKNGHLELNHDAIKEVIEKYSNDAVYAFGFTYIIWSVFFNEIANKEINFNFKDVKVFHSGGWKKLKEESVSKAFFSDSIAKVFDTEPKNIIDFYGMAEQTGIIFVDCEYGNKHVPAFSHVLIRNPQTLEPCGIDEAGMIEVMSTLTDSYYGQAILTEDMGSIKGIDDCPCGRNGQYFRFKARVEKAEVKGCGDTFKEE